MYFLLMIFKKLIELLKEYLKMSNLKLTDVNNYRLNQIDKIRGYFNNEINERKNIIKKLNKYIVGFDYLDKIFIALSASFGMLSIASHATIVNIHAGIIGSSLPLIFTLGMGISKLLLKVTKKRKKKHNKIIVLAKNKLNKIETLLSNTLDDSKISHEEFASITTEKNSYENIKENIKNNLEPTAAATVGPSSLELNTELPSMAELNESNSIKRK